MRFQVSVSVYFGKCGNGCTFQNSEGSANRAKLHGNDEEGQESDYLHWILFHMSIRCFFVLVYSGVYKFKPL